MHSGSPFAALTLAGMTLKADINAIAVFILSASSYAGMIAMAVQTPSAASSSIHSFKGVAREMRGCRKSAQAIDEFPKPIHEIIRRRPPQVPDPASVNLEG